MYHPTKDAQISISDRYVFASTQTKKAVDSSRAKLVGDVIYPNIDEDKFAPLFSDIASRPNESIRRYVSALVLKRVYTISDGIMLEMLRCGAVNFQYALHTTDEDTQPLSESSLRRFRRKIEEYNKEHHCDLIKEEFVRISILMAINMGLLGADPDTENEEGSVLLRMDSMEIEAHAKAMSRIEILYTTNIIVLRYLIKKGFKSIIPESFEHYYKKGDRNRLVYHRAKEDQALGKKDTRISELVQEMLCLKDVMEKNFSEGLLEQIPEYVIFIRVLGEQTLTDENGATVPKASKDISPNSVQNPFDTTVTYRHKQKGHHGFVMNAIEAVDDNGNGIIVDADIEQNTVNDSDMAEAYIERQPDNGPQQKVSVDGAYYNDDLAERAKAKNIELMPTALTGTEPYDIDADFVLNEEQTAVVTCPCGKVPVSNKCNENTGMIIATMPDNCCANCPYLWKLCNVRINKKKGTSKVRISGKMVDRAQMARRITAEEGKENARRRNGVEGIMSVMRRKYGLDHLPVFGLSRYKTWVWTTLLSYNLAKYQKYLAAQNRAMAK